VDADRCSIDLAITMKCEARKLQLRRALFLRLLLAAANWNSMILKTGLAQHRKIEQRFQPSRVGLNLERDSHPFPK
jgi:hypothetical protein